MIANGIAEQLDSMDPAGEEDRDEMVRDMLATLIEHLR